MHTREQREEMVLAVRKMALQLPAADQVQVALALARVSAESAGAEGVEWDLAAANTLDAIYRAVAERVVEVGGTVIKVTGVVIEDVVKPVAHTASWMLVALALALGGAFLVYREHNARR